ncbi:hypothetical protein MRB53_029737 [Persea americana]|uniref:Uncharacterized protein n=1 Tax=Persea americana TaxID=3435 RepID=A0ACC2KJX3_PERAE|nr:hypothetical protein MRB53_029737 [Persea americana]
MKSKSWKEALAIGFGDFEMVAEAHDDDEADGDDIRPKGAKGFRNFRVVWDGGYGGSVVLIRGSGNGCEHGDLADDLKGLCLCVGFLKVLLFGGGQWTVGDVQREMGSVWASVICGGDDMLGSDGDGKKV